jgi:hypothetical protein
MIKPSTYLPYYIWVSNSVILFNSISKQHRVIQIRTLHKRHTRSQLNQVCYRERVLKPCFLAIAIDMIWHDMNPYMYYSKLFTNKHNHPMAHFQRLVVTNCTIWLSQYLNYKTLLINILSSCLLIHYCFV